MLKPDLNVKPSEPAPEHSQLTRSSRIIIKTPRTKAAPRSMLQALFQGMQLRGWFSSIPPNHLPCIAECFLIICKGDKILAGPESYEEHRVQL